MEARSLRQDVIQDTEMRFLAELTAESGTHEHDFRRQSPTPQCDSSMKKGWCR